MLGMSVLFAYVDCDVYQQIPLDCDVYQQIPFQGRKAVYLDNTNKLPVSPTNSFPLPLPYPPCYPEHGQPVVDQFKPGC